MRLNEITNNVRKAKQLIDKMFVTYTTSKTGKLHMELVNSINKLYPTGYDGVDGALLEYKNILIDDMVSFIAQ